MVMQPDAFMGDGGFIAFGWLTMGQLLCIPMMLVGAGLLWWAYYKNAPKIKSTGLETKEPTLNG